MYLEDWRFLDESNECMVVFDKPLTGADYKIGIVDQSECMDIYLYEAFKIDIKE